MSGAYFISGRGAAIRRGLEPKWSDTPCACGAQKEYGMVVCLKCFLAAPSEMTALYRKLSTRHFGTIALKKFAAGRATKTTEEKS